MPTSIASAEDVAVDVSCAMGGPEMRIAVLEFDDIGRSEGAHSGPKPGRGAVLHHCSGEADFDGLPGDELPRREAVMRKLKEDAPAPPESCNICGTH